MSEPDFVHGLAEDVSDATHAAHAALAMLQPPLCDARKDIVFAQVLADLRFHRMADEQEAQDVVIGQN